MAEHQVRQHVFQQQRESRMSRQCAATSLSESVAQTIR
jgi:hypothetical protein